MLRIAVHMPQCHHTVEAHAVHQVSAVTDGTMRGVVPWRARVRRVWPVAKYIIGLGLAALAFYQLTGHQSELSETTVALGHLHWAWVALGVAAEAGSFLAFALLQRKMLRAGGVDVPVGPMAAITMAANAITNSIPAGSAIAPVYSFRQYRQRGADQALAGWSVVAAFVAESVGLALVAAAGVSVAEAEGASLDLVGVIVTVLILAVAMAVVFVQKRALVWTVSASLHLCQRLTGWPRGELAHHIDRIIFRLTVVRLSAGQMIGALNLALANWLLDCSCLAMSFLAVGAPVPWKGLLLAYGAGQLAANLPITPGGLGVVEGSLTIALVAYGGATTSTVVAVLLYRVLSFWVALPVGWGAWGWLAWLGRRRPRPTPSAAEDAGRPVSPDPGDADANGAALEIPDGDIREAVGE
jgi:putative heme transporter